MRVLRWLLFVFLPFSVVILLAMFVIFGMENEAAVKAAKAPTSADAVRASAFAKRAIKQMVNAESVTVLSISERDLDSAFALMNRGFRRLLGDAEVTPHGIIAAITLALPKNPVRSYVNIRFGIVPSDRGLKISKVSVGSIELTGGAATRLLQFGLNAVLGDNLGDDILGAVRSTRFGTKTVKLRIIPVSRLKARLKQAGDRIANVRDDVALLGDPALIRIYYARLVELDDGVRGKGPQSLSAFMTPLFQLSKSRGGDAVVENRAALLALVIYFGDRRFERLTGNVRTGSLQGHRRRGKQIRLEGRNDLMLHFLVSAGLQLVGDHGAAMAIGEFKELLDSTDGGTGFSFVDLGADRTGLRFAETATDNAGGAKRLQRLLAEATSEAAFFPRFRDLPERMPETTFKLRFGGVEDARYKAMVDKIDRRIDALPVYR